MARAVITRSRDRREEILAASLALFAEHGVQHVSTRQIARTVGISQPSLYAHFATREDIAVELCRRAFGRLRARMAAALDGGGSPRDRLLRGGAEYVAFGLEEPAAYRVAFMLERVGGPDGKGSEALAAGLAAFEILLRFFRDVRGDDGEGTDIAAQSCWASMHGLVSLLLTRPDFPWADRDRLIRHHLETAATVALGG